jgi:hypothetical protein
VVKEIERIKGTTSSWPNILAEYNLKPNKTDNITKRRSLMSKFYKAKKKMRDAIELNNEIAAAVRLSSLFKP